MSKYNSKLDIEHENSLSIIINSIRPNSKILEFGPAHGRLTEYLSHNMNCDVTIVELDEEAGKEAAQFAGASFIGNEQGDIEKYYWLNSKEKVFDYIIFADVLEHLYNPDKVLKACDKVLSKGGRILVSIPNIAHNSIIVNLLNNQFKYNSIGLLDNTHIKFFTYYSFIELVKSLGYEVSGVFATYSEVGENEIESKYDDVDLNIQKVLRKRPFGKVYQYIFELGRGEEVECHYEIKNHQDYPLFELNLYVKEGTDENYSESKKITKFYNSNKIKFELDLSAYKEIKSIRIDPIEYNGIVKVNKIYGVINGINEVINVVSSNAKGIIDNNIYFFDIEDPQITLNLNQAIEKMIVEFEIIDYQIDDYRAYDILIEAIKISYTLSAEAEKRREEISEYCSALEEKDKISKACIDESMKEIFQHKDYKEQLEKREEQYKAYQEILEDRIKEHKVYEKALEVQVEEHKVYEKALEVQVEEHKAYEKVLEENISKYKTYIKQIEEQLDSHKTYVSDLEDRIESHTKYQNELIKQLDNYKDNERVLNRHIKNDKQKIEQLQFEIEEKNRFIDQVKQSKLFKFIKIK